MARRLVGYTFLVVALLVELECPLKVALDDADHIYVTNANHRLVRISDMYTGTRSPLELPATDPENSTTPLV